MALDRRLFPALLLSFSGLLVLIAVAYPDHGASFADGAGRPLLGPGHLLAMVAVGLWSVQLKAMRPWFLPASFLAGMAAGIAAGLAGLALPWPEAGLAATVLILGLFLVIARPLPKPILLAVAAGLGVVHGLVLHGGIDGAQPAWTALGMLWAAAILLAAGLEVGVTIGRQPAGLRILGAAAGAAGLALLVL